MFPKLKFTKEQIEDYYSKVTPDMVRTSLAADRPTYFDLLNKQCYFQKKEMYS